MTPILQPLDVSLNRPFQQYYSLCYDDWIADSENRPNATTSQGNLRIPSYNEVTTWIKQFGQQDHLKEMTINSFLHCGITAQPNPHLFHNGLKKVLG